MNNALQLKEDFGLAEALLPENYTFTDILALLRSDKCAHSGGRNNEMGHCRADSALLATLKCIMGELPDDGLCRVIVEIMEEYASIFKEYSY